MVPGKKNKINSSVKNICKPSTILKSAPNENSNIETECLYGEKVKVLESVGKWIKCITLLDKYEGWIKVSDVYELGKTTHRVIYPRSFVYNKPNIKSYAFSYLPMGSKVKVDPYDNTWSKMNLFCNKGYKSGFILSKHIVRKNEVVKDWVSIAEKLIGVPYKWGGRDSMGIDCSALIQLSLETIGINFPRNSNDQENLHVGIPYNYKLISRGSLIYWNGHVGVMKNKNELLHANAFHMMVMSENINLAIHRIHKNYGPIKKVINNYSKLIK